MRMLRRRADEMPVWAEAGAPLRILLVTADRSEAGQVGRVLAGRGRLTATRSSPEALSLLEREPFDVCLFDLQLGEGPLLRFLRTVGARGDPLPVVLLAAPEDEELTVQGLRQGARDYLLRPSMTAEALLRSIRYATDRARADRLARRAVQRHWQLFHRSVAGAFRLSLDGRLLDCNSALLEMLGYASREEALAQGSLGLEDASTTGTESRGWLLELCLGRGREWALRRRDGSVIPVRVQAVVVDSQAGAPEAIEGTLTAAPQVESAAGVGRSEPAADAARARFVAIGRQVAATVHDLNNLLTAVLGYATLLTASLPEGQSRQSADAIRDAVARARELIGRTLSVRGKPASAAERSSLLELGPALQDLRESLSHSAGRGVDLVYELDEATPRVRVDPVELERVVTNLVLNACDAMPGGGGVIIGTRAGDPDETPAAPPGLSPGRYAVITIRDSGVGMDDETRERLFEPFFTTKRAGQGHGLGLMSVSDVVRRLHGEIAVHSAPGTGTEVEVWLPAAESA